MLKGNGFLVARASRICPRWQEIRGEQGLEGIRAGPQDFARFGPTTPKRAGRPADASVDHTEARKHIGTTDGTELRPR
jgi:hypothetical protein